MFTMKLQKLMLAIAAVGALTACSNSEENGIDNSWLANAPGTEVYMGVDALNNLTEVGTSSRAASFSSRATENPLAPVIEVRYFNVKVDPRLGYDVKPNIYSSVGKGVKVYTDCPFITVNKNKNYSYLLSTDGSGLRTLFAAGDTTSANVIKKISTWYKRTNPISPKVDDSKIHVIWYLAKSMDNGWHVDGLLTDKNDVKEACDACHDDGFQEITFGENDGKTQLTYAELMDFFPVNYKIKRLDKTLGVDIHQQSHGQWGEIKTSVHVKEAKDVTINIPVGIDYTLENAETDERARYFNEYYEIQNYDETIGAKVNVEVERLKAGVTINITGITEDLVKALERRYNDGFTVEIHTFYKLTDAAGTSDFKAPVWNAMKNSKVTYDGSVSGQITSAFFDSESVEIK